MRIANISLILSLIILVVACKKTPETLTTTNKIIIGASTVSSVGYFTASGTTQVNSIGGNTISEHGHCWSTNPNPDMNDSLSSMGQLSSPAAFTSDLSDLSAATKYYITPYLKYQYGIIYGVQIEFTTLQVPTVLTVTTDTASNITQTTATSGGNVISNGGDIVTARGVCWNTSPEPTLNNYHTIDSSGTGEFTSNLTGLIPDTLYYVRAYATNSAGIAYGNEITFETLYGTLPTVTTDIATNITQTTATSGGNVTSSGGDIVTARGVCWNTSGNPTLANSYTTNGGGTGVFTSNLAGLIPDILYHVRAYATNSAGTAYGNVITFTTLSNVTLPTVTTDDATNITQTTATSGGNVTSNGGDTVTARGVCWNTSPEPTLINSYTTDGGGTGEFTSNLTGLIPGTLYYVRAYATNSEGTAYDGIGITFTTLYVTLPTVTTDTATNITQTTATSGGNVTSDGGDTVTARGVCWNTSPEPTLINSYTTDGGGTGEFTSNLTGLIQGTSYYVRAYATNSVGTKYGNEITFTTLAEPCPGIPTVLYEGQTYNTVLIGDQCWLKENLNVGTMIPENQNQTNNSQVEKYCYGNDPANCTEYGGLYQWYEMMQYIYTQGTQGICPDGWHIPTDGEWTTLITYLGGESVAGGKLKEAGTVHWSPPNTGATNSSWFTGLPGGWRGNYGNFGGLFEYGTMWSSSEYVGSKAWYRELYYNNETVYRDNIAGTCGFSVRCLKN